MQKRMEVSYITKIYIAIRIFKNNLLALYWLRTLSLESLLNKLENKKKIFKKNDSIKLMMIIFGYERKISEILNIKKCLTSSVSIYLTLKGFNFDPKLFIGVKKDKDFKSHAWVECKGKSFLKDNQDSYSRILSI
tara:strand:- start:1974 stop:2378 length:405 start_codon:yes stop_codon:yes gene_type:complete